MSKSSTAGESFVIIEAGDCSSDEEVIGSSESVSDEPVKPKWKISVGSVFDSHCHLEFMQWRNAATETLSHCMERDREDLGDKFRGCIVNFCLKEVQRISSMSS